MKLADEQCQPVPRDQAPLGSVQVSELMNNIPGWSLREMTLQREFAFPGFPEAMAFANRIADLAQAQDHHPDITISYDKVRLVLVTHRIHGLSRNDFILAAKINRLHSDAS
ncbi:MAG: 4a-hydroxytetrahydrobiopterin dehydratase [Acidobacteria bacterium 21-70-11]|nr:MAG: 4a-hydroxytetrahydrobiopterin dehydratase [Acidobacteria bacterium 21-70-11]OYW06631.1 MAG: 4a-hydroxytetrahydrobiopterin dehydratase [Acidobacteria bacterium 37-71-11]HQT94292.1 4a-hydroxytetrahydrobiopterin dehydratase [Thermoanaerobaculaceae bacterium]